MPTLLKVSEWRSEHELRLGSVVGLGDLESEEEWPDSARARSQCVPSAQLKMPGWL